MDNKICLCDWKYRKMRAAIDQRISNYFKAEFSQGTSKVIDETILQLDEYFNVNRRDFTVPILFAGSEFQVSVWKELQNISYGKTESYLNLSKKLGNEKAIRAVAAANGANAISIIVPCHRIIGSNRELTGYAGGLKAKKSLLELEGALSSDQLSLF